MNKTPEPMPLFEDDSAHGTPDDAGEPVSAHEELPSEQAADDAAAPDAADDAAAPPDSDDDAAALPEATGDAAGVDEPPAESAPAAASVAFRGVGSTDEMDAWLSGSPQQPVSEVWLGTDAEADAAMEAWLAAAPNAAVAEDGPVVVTGGRLDRIRPKRKPFVPIWLVWVVLAALVLGGILAGTAALLAVRSRVFVPTVAGLQTPAARDRLATVGLKLVVSDRRFSTLPVDTILAQTPEVGAQAKRGSAVTVVVSAGTEEFTMPDIVGEGLTLARSQLEQKGLQVQVETQTSDQPSDTVLATNPAAGATIHTGDIVKLTVATGTNVSTPTSGTLVPYSLTGVRITLDPAPPIAGQPDTALEVSRRLRSLLEASGATILSTRSITDTGSTGSATARQQRAREGSPTLAIGFDVTASGAPGVGLSYPNSSVATASASSQALSSQITSALAGQAINARQAAGGSDVVLSVTNAPYLRMTLGSTASREDLASFRDPGWADKIARATYQGIAAIYGVRN